MNDTSKAQSAYRSTWLAHIVVALALAGAAASASAQQAPPGISNFGKVNDNYYRGAQPEAGQYRELRRAGIKTVIDLRADAQRDARERAGAAGLRYFNLPLAAGTPASEVQTEQFLRLVNDPDNWPVYVHCDGGRSRTGALTAAYRITSDGWTADRAFAEMLSYGFDGGDISTASLSGGDAHARQKWFVYALYERHASAQDPARAN